MVDNPFPTDEFASLNSAGAAGETGRGESLFAQRYRITKLLGEGGMGKVYLAEDSMLDHELVALKILHSGLCNNDSQQKRFLREVKLSRQVTHSAIVKTYDFGRTEDLIYFTMEYVRGMTLKSLLSETGAMPVEQAISLIGTICEALEAIHLKGITHRDLKPANIMVSYSGEVKLTDFGVARPRNSDLTHHEEIVGSPVYISPEIWAGDGHGPSSDIYSLGVLSYELLTGMPPFDGTSPAEVMCKHLECTPLPAIELQDGIPLWLNSLMMRMLEKNPANRPSIKEILRELNQPSGETNGEVFSGISPFSSSDPAVDDFFHEDDTFDYNPDTEGPELKNSESSTGVSRSVSRSSSDESIRKSLFSGATGRKLLHFSLCAALVFILFSTLSELSSLALERATIFPTTLLVSFALIVTLIYASLLLSFPLFALSFFANNFSQARQHWMKFSKITGAMFVICFLISFALYDAPKTDSDDITAKRGDIILVASVSSTSIFEAALLIPVQALRPVSRESYRAVHGPTRNESEHNTPLSAVPFYLCLLVYLTLIVRGGLNILEKNPTRAYTLIYLFLILMALSPGAFFSMLLFTAPGHIPYFLLEQQTFAFGSVLYEIQTGYLIASGVNWLALFIVAAFFLHIKKSDVEQRKGVLYNPSFK